MIVFIVHDFISHKLINQKTIIVLMILILISFFNAEKVSNNSWNILKRFKVIVFFKSLNNSDRKGCLNTFIVQDYIHPVIVFFEIQLRTFVNFFHNIVKDNYIRTKDEIRFFLEQCFTFSFDFAIYSIRKVKISFFEEIFDEFDYTDSDSNIIKVINKKYIEYCDRKYAS